MNVTVRMYNTGFGDCFLLKIPVDGRHRKILIDCGKHMLSQTGPKLDRIVGQLLADIEEEGAPRLDVVVATHRHQDHVSGFADARWNGVRVSEVWMPWTEDPDDPEARDICDRQSSRAALALHGLATLNLADARREYLLGYAGNNLRNADAMNALHRGFRGNPLRSFLPEAEPKDRVLRTDVLPGVEVHVLGPPRDREIMREMNPPDSESFLRAWLAEGSTSGSLIDFGEQFLLTREEYKQALGDESLDEDFPAESEDHLAAVLDEPEMDFLVRLEAAVNATSLVLLFRVGRTWLLFPADAQWGTWNAILNDPAQSRLLRDLAFYKVGHHGSHNATPMSFVEDYLGPNVHVMLPYGTVDRWPGIPRPGLLQRLHEKGASIARSDEIPPDGFSSQMVDGDVLSIDLELPG